MQYIGSLEAAEKHISAKIFKENLHTSVKILQICMDLQDSVQRSLYIVWLYYDLHEGSTRAAKASNERLLEIWASLRRILKV